MTAATVATLCATAWLVDVDAPTDTARSLLLCFLPYGLLLWVDVGDATHARRLALGGATVAGLCMVAAPDVLSDDVYRYLWDGGMWLSGRDAYALPPDHPSLSSLRTADFERINHAYIPTLYPPLAQVLFALVAALWAHPAVFGLLALGFHLATTRLSFRLAGGGTAGARAALLFGLNPLALAESALGGHVDAAAGLCMVALCLALAARRTGAAVAITGALAGIKLLGPFVAPLLWRLRGGKAATVVALALCGLFALPPMMAGHGADATASGLSHYAQRWRGNEGPFVVLEYAARPLSRMLQSPDRSGLGEDEVRLRLLQGPLAALAPDRAVFAQERKAPRPAGAFARDHVVFMLARALSLLLVFAVAGVCVARGVSPANGLRAILWVLLLTSPQLHPWYLLWLLPLDIAVGKRAAIVWSATALLAYAPLTDWHLHRSWQPGAADTLLMYLPVALALGLEHWPGDRSAPTCGLPLTATTGKD